MKSDTFEILLPSLASFPDEEAYQLFEVEATKLRLGNKQKKRFCMIAMELFQNIRRHRVIERLSLLRIRQLPDLQIQIRTFNLAHSPTSEKLKEKFHILKNTNNLKLHYQQKLLSKTSETNRQQGDLGMEICFRHTLRQNLQIIPVGPELNLIYVEFLLSDNE
jgi:predicted lipase